MSITTCIEEYYTKRRSLKVSSWKSEFTW